MKEKTNRLYQFNGFELEVDEGILKKGENKIPLTPKAFETLVVLIENRGRVVDKEVLLNEIWADTFVEETTLAQNIFTIRKALGAGENGSSLIETVPRRGYKFVADVTELLGTDEAVIIQKNIRTEITTEHEIIEISESPDQTETTFLEQRDVKIRNLSFRRILSNNYARPVLAGLFLVSVILAFYGLTGYFGRLPLKEANAPLVRSIAVLPFQSIGEQNNDGKLGFGMADAIITRLSKLEKIPVRPTSAIFQFTERPPQNPVDAGRALGVDAVLEGTVQREGKRVRISVRLLRVSDSKPLWAETFDEKYEDVFALQDSISTQIARSLAFKLTPEQEKLLEHRPTNNKEAFEAYQLGVYLWNTRTPENLQKARGYFEKAVELDPEFAGAYGMLADTYNLIAIYIHHNDNELYEKARFAAMKALSLDDSVAEAYLALSAFQRYSNNLKMTRHYLEEAVRRAPYNSTVRVRYSWILLRLGNLEQAEDEMKKAHENDPLSPVTSGAFCNMLVYREKFGEATSACRKATEISADTASNRLWLALALFFNGNVEEAIKQAEIEAQRGAEKDLAFATLGYFYAKLGRRQEAEIIIARLKKETEKNPDVLVGLTLIAYTLGRKDEALKNFKEIQKKKLLPEVLFYHNPAWKDVSRDQRFASLTEQSG